MIIKDLPNPKHPISIVRLLYIDEFYRFPFPFPDSSTPINNIDIDVDEYVTDIDINSPLNITNYIKYNLSISGSVETKTIICDPIIYLTANVIGNPINHTFLWEDVTNTNVSIFTVDNFNAYYINSPPVDRVIRFYIDKGTVDEQFKEITIRATPSTSVSNSSISSPLNIKKSIHPDLNSLNYFSVGAFNQNIRFNSNGSYFNNMINIEWKLPNIFSNNYTFDNSLIYRDYYQNASLEIFLNGEWITVSTKNKNEPNIASNIPINELLRIKYNYKKYGHINNETYYTGYFVSSPSLSGNNLISDLHLDNSSKITNNIYRNVVSVLSLPIDQNFNDININSSSNTVNTVYRNVYNVNLVDCESTVSDISIAHPKLVKFSITRLSGTTIGG